MELVKYSVFLIDNVWNNQSEIKIVDQLIISAV